MTHTSSWRARLAWFVLLQSSLLLSYGCASSPARQARLVDGAQAQPPGQVLIILTAATRQRLADQSERETGYFLNELYEPYKALISHGYKVIIATDEARSPALDPESLKLSYWDDDASRLKEAKAFTQSEAMTHPISLSDALKRVDELQGVLVPGGQGVMVDLLDHPLVHELIIQVGQRDRPVGLICHAPAILARLPQGRSPFEGAAVTSVSGVEEWYIERFVMGAKAQVRQIEDLLQDKGYRHDSAWPGRSNAVRDCNLVTSQNPFSGESFNALYLRALADWRQGARCSSSSEAP